MALCLVPVCPVCPGEDTQLEPDWVHFLFWMLLKKLPPLGARSLICTRDCFPVLWGMLWVLNVKASDTVGGKTFQRGRNRSKE